MIDAAIPAIPHEQARDAARLMLGSGRDRYEPLKVRGALAAQAYRGQSYHAFRRKGKGMDYVLELLATAMLVQPHGERADGSQHTTTDLSSSGHQEQRGRTMATIGVIALILSGTIFLINRPTLDDSGSSPASPTTTCIAPGEGDIGEISAAISEAVAPIQEAQGTLCGHKLAEWRGQVVFQELQQKGQIFGGVLAWYTEDKLLKVDVLNLGIWQSYMRIGGGNGERSPILGGLPTGRHAESSGLWNYELDGGAELYGEDEQGTHYWLPTIAAERWREEGGVDGWLGRPASSPYWRSGVLTVDFTGGSIQQRMDGTLEAVEPQTDPEVELGPVNSILGTVVTSADGTAWIVDGNGGRWWISSGLSWHCANGESMLSRFKLSGTAIHLLPYRGFVTCPVRVDGYRHEGPVDINLYCLDQFDAAAAEISNPEHGWRCGESHPPLEPDDVCRWQYGQAMTALSTPGDRYSWSCKR